MLKTISNGRKQWQLMQQTMNSVPHGKNTSFEAKLVGLLRCGTERAAVPTLVVQNKIQPVELSGFKLNVARDRASAFVQGNSTICGICLRKSSTQ